MGIDAEILLRVKGDPSDADVRRWADAISAEIGKDAFMTADDMPLPERGAITRSLARYRDDGYPPPGRAWHQDGDDILAEPDETFLQVHLWTRYWAPGYERGDLDLIIKIAEWCERNIPNCAVWYGGDSSGVCAEPFDAAKRKEYLDHKSGPDGDAYHRRWDSLRGYAV